MTNFLCETCGEYIFDIVELVMHECDEILRAKDLSTGEQSTLLYIDTRVVDHDGQLEHERMNHEEQQNIKLFQAADVLRVEEFQVTEVKENYWNLMRDVRKERSERRADTMTIEDNV